MTLHFKSSGLIGLAEEISKRHNVESMICLLLYLLFLIIIIIDNLLLITLMLAYNEE